MGCMTDENAPIATSEAEQMQTLLHLMRFDGSKERRVLVQGPLPDVLKLDGEVWQRAGGVSTTSTDSVHYFPADAWTE